MNTNSKRPDSIGVVSSSELPKHCNDSKMEPEAGCPIERGLFEIVKCGRKLHAAPQGIDEQPVCLMHSKDEQKQSGQLFEEFWRVFEEILNEAGDTEAHFERFVFPGFQPTTRNFRAICLFDGATFTQMADFYSATFARSASFCRATFVHSADFELAQFENKADFNGAKFKGKVDFSDVGFGKAADFTRAIFTKRVYFGSASFTENADFSFAHFKQAAFRFTNFMQKAAFVGATFEEIADFEEAEFHAIADFRETEFLDQAKFRCTLFEGTPSANFSLARFSEPENVVFSNTDLSRVLFTNCDVSAIQFAPSVRWSNRNSGRRVAIFDESLLLDPTLSYLNSDYGINHAEVEQTYHHLKKNYDLKLDYRKADEFHFGEMEMRRLEIRTHPIALKPWLGLRRWLGAEAWYRYASDYGNSYTKPAWWLASVLLVAALCFPICGLEAKDRKNEPAVTYSGLWNRNDTWTNNCWTEGKLLGKSAIAAIDSASFQRNPEYMPTYPWGRVAAILETLLTSTLFGLLLLAIRRQFKR